MESTLKWFSEGPMKGTYVRNAIIKTSHPVPLKWKITAIINEHDHQIYQAELDRDKDVFSCATTRLRCTRLDDPSTIAEMRVYLQVPYSGMEYDRIQRRAQQEEIYEPSELRAYKKLTRHGPTQTFTPRLLGYSEDKQGPTGWVPGGFLVTVVWERVSGESLALRLKDRNSLFWELPLEKRNLIREMFVQQLANMARLGVMLHRPTARNLVFDRRAERLYWVGFYNAKVTRGARFNKSLIAAFDLAKPPAGSQIWRAASWSGDLSGWGL
ncbi:hypothetical protein N7456_000990 [Penicillium angulare]|uniref:Protein kinase domain-containing protein n=1 Tax=Penicillium angulare TaxID=116970 RepID=A0A9W9KRF6_9EURO|nr:hypothetical protein N7456_000990 [Penicillium angulare]